MGQMVARWLVVLVALGAEMAELEGLAIFRHDLYAGPCPSDTSSGGCSVGRVPVGSWGMWHQLT